jgi:hypothetical protein
MNKRYDHNLAFMLKYFVEKPVAMEDKQLAEHRVVFFRNDPSAVWKIRKDRAASRASRMRAAA